MINPFEFHITTSKIDVLAGDSVSESQKYSATSPIAEASMNANITVETTEISATNIAKIIDTHLINSTMATTTKSTATAASQTLLSATEIFHKTG